MNNVQIWQLFVTAAALGAGWLTSYNLLREKVIRLEEKVSNLTNNHERYETLMTDIKIMIEKVWEKLDKKVDKK
jgi:CHASE3 domain sensor protein